MCYAPPCGENHRGRDARSGPGMTCDNCQKSSIFETAMDPKEVLRTYWGYEGFRPSQEEIIRHALDGEDIDRKSVV